jgi:hypothetical protein
MDQGGDRGITLIHREVGMRKSDHWSQAVFPETERDLGQELDSVDGWLLGCFLSFPHSCKMVQNALSQMGPQ